jgi:tetratricopeptide (TPR) repeat protein
VIDPTQYVRHPANLLPLDPGDWEKLVSHFVDLAKKGERLQWGEASALGAPKELKASLAEEANNITEILTLSLDDANTTYAVRAEEAADRVVRAALAFGRYQRFSGLGEAILLQHTIDVTEQLAHKFGRSKRGNTFLRLQAESHRVYASMLRMRSDLKRALTHYGKAKILYRRIGDGLGLAHCRRSLGDIARVRAKFERALRYYDKAVGLYDTELECIRHDNSDAKYRDICRGKANCIQRRGEIIRSREDKEEAKLYFEKALNIYSEIGDLIGQGFCEKGFADILSRDENTKDDARKKYERARKLFEEAGYLLGAADCHYSLGDLRLRWATTQENYAETLTEYQKAERLYEKIISKHGLANCHYSFGDVALALGQSPVAKDSYNRALGEYGSVGSKLGPANCFQGLSDVSEDPIAKKTFEQDATKNATKAFTDLVRTPKEQPQGFQFRAVDGTRKTYCRWRR